MRSNLSSRADTTSRLVVVRTSSAEPDVDVKTVRRSPLGSVVTDVRVVDCGCETLCAEMSAKRCDRRLAIGV